MLFNYIADNYITQVFFILALGGCYCVTMIKRHVAKEHQAERDEKRFSESRALVLRTGKADATDA